MEPIEIHDRGRGPELRGTRTTVYDIVPYRLAGHPPEYIARAMGHTPEEVQALFDYMDAHHDAVMAVHRAIEERNARRHPPEVEAKVRAGSERVRAFREAVRRYREGGNGAGHPG